MNAGAALQQFDFSPNLALTPGSQYVAFSSIANLFGMPHGIDQISGEFVFLNNGNSPSEWTTSPWTLGWIGQDDVWFGAAFDLTPTPEPATLLLAGTTLAGLGLTHWRRNRASR